MGADKHFRMGSFYRIDDRTGFATRAEDTQMEWQGLMVSRRVFERRHPQDFVKGVADNQTVPYARPRSSNPAVGTSLAPQFQVFGDLPTGVTFEVQAGKINVFKAASVVRASNFPSGF